MQGQSSKVQSTYCSRYRFDSNTLKRYMLATEAFISVGFFCTKPVKNTYKYSKNKHNVTTV